MKGHRLFVKIQKVFTQGYKVIPQYCAFIYDPWGSFYIYDGLSKTRKEASFAANEKRNLLECFM